MKKQYRFFLKENRKFLVLLNVLLSFSFLQEIHGQLNISQTPNVLKFRPMTSGKLTVWEHIDYTESTWGQIRAFDGHRIININPGKDFGLHYIGQVSGNCALSRFKNSSDQSQYVFYNGKNNELLPIECTDNNAIISDTNVFWLDQKGRRLNYFHTYLSSNQVLDYATDSVKTLLSLSGKSLTFYEKGNLINFRLQGNLPFITTLNAHPYPTDFTSDSIFLAWVEFDGNDNEIFYYDGTKRIQITDNNFDDVRPTVSGDKVAWLGNQNDVQDLYFYNGNTTQRITKGEFPKFGKIAISNHYPVWDTSGYKTAIFAYNGKSVINLAKGIEYPGFAASKNHVAWVEFNKGDSTVSLFDYKWFNIEKVFTKKSDEKFTVGSTFQIFNSTLVWDSHYTPSEIFLFDLEKRNYSNYYLGRSDVNACTAQSKISLPFITKKGLPDGMVGLEYTINYDSNYFAPTGNFTLKQFDPEYAEVALNTSSAGKVYVSIYLNGAPQGRFAKAQDTILSVDFHVKNTPGFNHLNFTTSGIREGFVTKSFVNYPADSTQIYFGNIPVGRIYGNFCKSTPLVNNYENSASYFPTHIYEIIEKGTVCNGDTITEILTDSTGTFNFQKSLSPGYIIKIGRDIPGDAHTAPLACEDIMERVNSADRNKALSIANNTYTNPTLSELIASDVNLDGKVTAADVALISSRTINGNSCEYPQADNYEWNGKNYVPKSGYSHSKDWLFLDSNMLGSLNHFIYSKNYVPKVYNCLFTGRSNQCELEYFGILLGDVSASCDNAALRLAENDKATISLNEIVHIQGDEFKVPLQINASAPVEGFDFSMKFNKEALDITKVTADAKYPGYIVEYNIIESQKLMVTSYDAQGFQSEGNLLYVHFRTRDVNEATEVFKSMKAFVNGQPAQLEDQITSVRNGQNALAVKIAPNPSSGNVTITTGKTDGKVTVEVLNMLGEVHLQFSTLTNSSSLEKELDLSHLNSGNYLIKVSTASGVTIEKLVLQ